MTRAAGAFQGFDKFHQFRVTGQFPRTNGGIDAGQVLHNDAPGAYIHVTDFGISHLALWQADFLGACVQVRSRNRAHQPVPIGRVAQGNGVVIGLFAHPPAVEDAEHDGAGNAILIFRIRHGTNIRI